MKERYIILKKEREMVMTLSFTFNGNKLGAKRKQKRTKKKRNCMVKFNLFEEKVLIQMMNT